MGRWWNIRGGDWGEQGGWTEERGDWGRERKGWEDDRWAGGQKMIGRVRAGWDGEIEVWVDVRPLMFVA